MNPPPDNPDTQAEAVGRHMEAHDLAGRHLGLTLATIRPGCAEVVMTVRPDMVNGHGICHGGVTYTLADTAFAYACNARNEKSLALQCAIHYSAPAHVGDTLQATAQEIQASGKTGVYDVAIRNQHGQTVALFRGTAYNTRSPVIP